MSTWFVLMGGIWMFVKNNNCFFLDSALQGPKCVSGPENKKKRTVKE